MRKPFCPRSILALALCAAASLAPGRAEACSRPYLIFFAEGSTAITERGGQIMQEYASVFLNPRVPPPQGGGLPSCGGIEPGDWKIVLLAHADDPQAHDPCALSESRGHAVRARLAMLGIPEEAIAVHPLGDRNKLVPSPQGVGDPQNRFVHIFTARADEVTHTEGPYPRWTNPDLARWRNLDVHACRTAPSHQPAGQPPARPTAAGATAAPPPRTSATAPGSPR